MNLCKDCAHLEEQTGYCLRTQHTDPVTGNPKYFYARIEREYQVANGCGMAAQYYKPIRSLAWTDEELDDLSKIPFGR